MRTYHQTIKEAGIGAILGLTLVAGFAAYTHNEHRKEVTFAQALEERVKAANACKIETPAGFTISEYWAQEGYKNQTLMYGREIWKSINKKSEPQRDSYAVVLDLNGDGMANNAPCDKATQETHKDELIAIIRARSGQTQR